MLKPGQPNQFTGSGKLITNPNMKDNFPAHLCPLLHLTIEPLPSPQMSEQYLHYFNQKDDKGKGQKKKK